MYNIIMVGNMWGITYKGVCLRDYKFVDKGDCQKLVDDWNKTIKDNS